MAVSKRMTPVNVFGFVRYDQGGSHPSTNVVRQGGAINSGDQFDRRFNSRRQSDIKGARERQLARRRQANGGAGHIGGSWQVIASKLGGPTKVENWGRNGQITDVPPLTDLHYRATEASWHTGGGPLDPELDGEGVKEYAHEAQPVSQAKAELAEALKPAKKPRKPRAKGTGAVMKKSGFKPPRKFSKQGGFIFTKLYVPSVKKP